MDSRVKGTLCAFACAAAVLTGATTAGAVDQFPKNGCESPQPYSGSIMSSTFNTDVEFGAQVNFQGWFEIESVAPGSFDTMNFEYRSAPTILFLLGAGTASRSLLRDHRCSSRSQARWPWTLRRILLPLEAAEYGDHCRVVRPVACREEPKSV